MNWPRLTAALLALALHAAIIIAFLGHTGPVAFEGGTGSDDFTVIATVNLERRDLFTQAAAQASADAIRARPEPRETPAEDKPKDAVKPFESPEKTDVEASPKEIEKAQESEPPPMAKRSETWCRRPLRSPPKFPRPARRPLASQSLNQPPHRMPRRGESGGRPEKAGPVRSGAFLYRYL